MFSSDLLDREKKIYPSTFFIRFYPMSVKRAKGYKIWDENDREYIDLTASWAVANIGYGDPRIVEAFNKVYSQVTAIPVITFSHRTTLELAEELARYTPGKYEKKVVFGFSGSDINDAVYKLFINRSGRRFRILSFAGSYHGQTTGSAILSGHPALSRIRVLGGDVIKAPYPYCYRCPFREEYPGCSLACIDFIKKYLFKTVAPPDTISGLIFEPFQSDGGDLVPPREYVKELKRLAEENDIWFFSDEVKVGLGRTGMLWGIENFDVTPDGVTIGKPLASGLPISALVARSDLFTGEFTHLFTLSGHPAIASVALTTLKIIIGERLYERARELGSYLMKRLRDLQDRYSIIGDVRGLGLIIGIELVKDPKAKEPARKETAKVVYRLWQLGVLTTYVGIYSNVIELTPPLIIDKEALDEALDRMDRAFDDVSKGKISDEEISSFAGW